MRSTRKKNWNLQKKDKILKIKNMPKFKRNLKVLHCAFFFAVSTPCLGQISIKQLNDSTYSYSKSIEANQEIKMGIAAAKVKKYDVAKSHFKSSISLDSQFPFALDNLANVYMSLNQLDSAKLTAEKSLQIYPQGNSARLKIADIFSRQKKNTAAIRLISEVIKSDPQFAEAHAILAKELLKVDQPKLAIPYALKAMELFQKAGKIIDFGYAAFFAGMCYTRLKDTDNANKYFDMAENAGLSFKRPEY